MAKHKLHHRHKQRILTTIILLIILILCFDIFFLIGDAISIENNLLLTFSIGIILLILYQLYNYKHCHEHITLINNLTQIYLGTILLISIIILFLLKLFFSIPLITSYIVFSIIVILLTFVLLGRYNRLLENHISKKFPMNVPEPKNKKIIKKIKKRS